MKINKLNNEFKIQTNHGEYLFSFLSVYSFRLHEINSPKSFAVKNLVTANDGIEAKEEGHVAFLQVGFGKTQVADDRAGPWHGIKARSSKAGDTVNVAEIDSASAHKHFGKCTQSYGNGTGTAGQCKCQEVSCNTDQQIRTDV